MLASRFVFASTCNSETYDMVGRNIQARPRSRGYYGRASTHHESIPVEIGSNRRGEAVVVSCQTLTAPAHIAIV
jgi:hypothetical protein